MTDYPSPVSGMREARLPRQQVARVQLVIEGDGRHGFDAMMSDQRTSSVGMLAVTWARVSAPPSNGVERISRIG
jgi:hypothetical protein